MDSWDEDNNEKQKAALIRAFYSGAIRAFVEGRKIQRKFEGSDEWQEFVGNKPNFYSLDCEWRVVKMVTLVDINGGILDKYGPQNILTGEKWESMFPMEFSEAEIKFGTFIMESVK